jgi:RimJ/RimL family protein N-acetyltransferase
MFKLVQNKKEHHEFIRKLRNDKRVKSGFIQQKSVSKKAQEEYMKKYGNLYYVCLYNGAPAGYIGIIDNDIRVATHPDYQGLGVALFMIKSVMKKHRGAQAKIKTDNIASKKLFEKAGFKLRYFIYEP